MDNVESTVVTVFPPGKGLVLSYAEGKWSGIFQLIKFIYPDFQFGGSPTAEASGFWSNIINKYTVEKKNDLLLYYNDTFIKYSQYKKRTWRGKC